MQKQVALLKETNQKINLDLNEQGQKIEKKKQKLVEFKGEQESKNAQVTEMTQALEETRNIVVQFKS